MIYIVHILFYDVYAHHTTWDNVYGISLWYPFMISVYGRKNWHNSFLLNNSEYLVYFINLLCILWQLFVMIKLWTLSCMALWDSLKDFTNYYDIMIYIIIIMFIIILLDILCPILNILLTNAQRTRPCDSLLWRQGSAEPARLLLKFGELDNTFLSNIENYWDRDRRKLL